MVATLQSRKEALEAKIIEKNEELKKLCLQEADLTGVMPPEIPLEPGEPPPPIRRRVGTSFSFPQSLINNVKEADGESLTALELECKVQTNIAEAALALANDTSANKAARRKHRLMYRQSQRRLMELETRLNLLKQGKSQQLKPQQIKKKPRPNTTAVEDLRFLWNKTIDHNLNSFTRSHLGSWSGKSNPEYTLDDVDGEFSQQNDVFGSLYRSFKSTGTSQSSGSPRADIENEEYKLGANQLFNSLQNNLMAGFYSYPTVQDTEASKINLSSNQKHHKKNEKRVMVKKQWDTQSAGGTLLPSQTYPDHSHHPNLSRTQSLGSVESNPQKSKDSWSIQDFSYEGNTSKEKEWYETSLDSAPSPPLRTTSRLPTTARMLFQMQEIQSKDASSWKGINVNTLQPFNSHPVLPTTPNMVHKNVIRSASTYPATENTGTSIDNVTNSLQQLHFHGNSKGKISGLHQDEADVTNKKEQLCDYASTEVRQPIDYSPNIKKSNSEGTPYQNETKSKPDLSYLNTSKDAKLTQNSESNLTLIRQNSLNQPKHKVSNGNELCVKKHDDSCKANNSVYVNIPEDSSDLPANWLSDEEFNNRRKGGQKAVPQEYVGKTQTPTQPYYHPTKNSPSEKIKNLQYQAARNRHTSITEEKGNYQSSSFCSGTHHPPHAITQNEISFDTVVPFESPQNHTVVQAGKWQPYREVTKPFEMSDFYKYSTKFRQNKTQGNRVNTPDITRHSPTTTHQKGVYTPLKPMTCQPVESKNGQPLPASQRDVQSDKVESTMVEVSPPEIV